MLGQTLYLTNGGPIVNPPIDRFRACNDSYLKAPNNCTFRQVI
jgi:hypothetical protein